MMLANYDPIRAVPPYWRDREVIHSLGGLVGLMGD